MNAAHGFAVRGTTGPAIHPKRGKDDSATDTGPIVAAVVAQLESAWNAADGGRFAEPFAEDADFVTIRGDLHQGRASIAQGHDAIFSSIYRDSRIRYEVIAMRRVSENVVLAHLKSRLDAPHGPLAGTNHALASVILAYDGSHWHIEAFHNTLVASSPAGTAASSRAP